MTTDTQTLTHHQKFFDSKYLRWFHLPDKTALIRIDKHVEEKMMMPTGIEAVKPTIYYTVLAGAIDPPLPLVLNITNSNKIAEIIGSDFVENWPGHELVLYVTKTPMFNKQTRRMGKVDCIRIRQRKNTKDDIKATKESMNEPETNIVDSGQPAAAPSNNGLVELFTDSETETEARTSP